MYRLQNLHQKIDTRRASVRRRVQHHRRYVKQVQEKLQVQHPEEAEEPCSSNDDSAISSDVVSPTSPLRIKMSFKRRISTRKRISRALSRAHRRIEKLNLELQRVTRQKKTVNKRYERVLKKVNRNGNSSTSKASLDSMNTPRSKANQDLRNAGLSPRSVPRGLKKQLLFSHALLDEIRESTKINQGKTSRKVIGNVLSGKVIKKYRLISRVSSESGLGRRNLSKTVKHGITIEKNVRKAWGSLHNEVISFLERDDNSRVMPGKRDACKTSTNEKRQIRYLNDYMMNLFAKYKSEHPERRKVSFSAFKKIRQRNSHIKLVKFTARNTSLCQKHQNIALQLKVLKSLGVLSITSPDEAIKSITDTEMAELVKSIPDQDIQYEEWTRVADDTGRKKTKLVEHKVNKLAFSEIVVSTVTEFRKHAQRVTAQYTAIKECKESLKEGECVIHMDFAQNYTCVPMDEVQSAYWNQAGVTLHPIVAYFISDREIKHNSFVAVSDTRAHNASTVFAILKKLVPKLADFMPELKSIHYWTDSPTSQYRNKTIFSIVADHNTLFPNIKASWDYFEAGHGKGPCDGIGGTVKRLADEAVKRGAAVIQDAHDFFAWACQEREGSDIEYFFVTNQECLDAEAAIQEKWPNIRAVPGTTNLHAVRDISGGIMVRNTSCYCKLCREMSSIQNMCHGWKVHSLTKRQKQVDKDENREVQVHIDDWVSALYDQQWYIGKVIELDDEDAFVSFLKSGSRIDKNVFQWPNIKDEIWIPIGKIICRVEIEVKGCKGRLFHISELERQRINANYEQKLKEM